MEKFIKTCRREWKRLGVPDAVANEMAADLEADLKEAESEGASAEDVLGSGVFDPRSFAASWAAERGVIPPEPSGPRLPWRSPMLAAIIALTAVAAVGLGMVIASRVGSPRTVTLAAGPPFAQIRPDVPGCYPAYPPAPPPVVRTCVGPPRETIHGGPPRVAFRVVPGGLMGSRLYPVGWTLLIIGIVGIILLMGISRAVRGRWSRRPGPIGDANGDRDST